MNVFVVLVQLMIMDEIDELAGGPSANHYFLICIKVDHRPSAALLHKAFRPDTTLSGLRSR